MLENDSSEPLLRVRNHHSPSCGDPPIINGDDADTYIGYFENAFGEQWTFVYSRKKQRAVLRGGDVGWNTELEVRDGFVQGLSLGPAEAMWLTACWLAATGTPASV
jgi:hypothetical protein